LLTFFVQAKKVSRSPKGRVEALLLNNQKQKLDSSLRWNDEQKQKRWIPACAGMTSKKAKSLDSR
jgi:hypothetical protein